MTEKKRNYQRKKQNLNNLYAVSSSTAYDKRTKKLKKGVFGVVSKDVPFVFKNTKDRKTGSTKRSFLQDLNTIPTNTKNRVMAFYDKHKSSNKCYLMDGQYIERGSY